MSREYKAMKKNRDIIFNKFGGKCAYCGADLVKGWHIDHFHPIVRIASYDKDKMQWKQDGTCRNPENECIENYMPSCASCNIIKGSNTLERFRVVISEFINSLNLYSTQYKFAKRYGLVTEEIKPVVFYFETCKAN